MAKLSKLDYIGGFMNIKTIIKFLQGLGIPAKVITVIVILLLSITVLFFMPGCAYKFHADKIDNITREITFER